MAYTTPPRPVDIAALFPELRAYAATTTRLHPRPGGPTAADSSVGGPLLWPADEAWPFCHDRAKHYVSSLHTPAVVRRSREIRAAAHGRDYTAAERAEMPGWDFSEPHHLVDQPIPLIPVAQLYRRDVPDFAGPDDCDLLQVLWCPLDHPADDYNPRVRVLWRRSADVTEVLGTPPEPPVVVEHYLPATCAVFPEQVTEYPSSDLLPDDLRERIDAWDEEEDLFHFHLSLVPGWKVGGYPDWSVGADPEVTCVECGAKPVLLLAVSGGEWAREGDSWRPVEEPPHAEYNPPEVVIGRGWDLNVMRCPESFDHPVVALGP
ncbi:hypothetical protein Q0Z83_020690 [Actinoplanes sichuanensis]|uniref:DUF1963 domain-containing protein n=1 Tax=Actinoplanes sichuanensis TaxID=512349 RepID=A0ABW4AK47_9ACTN|nr:hypothetical protein [Actinoplanes sichuanensis]BEL03878.1 hypothetical protein Q0Z83_020690 [Actinoplanes sichuanensis]